MARVLRKEPSGGQRLLSAHDFGEMLVRLANKVALITGASNGVGKATAIRFAREGARLVVCDLDDAVAETVAEIRLQGAQALGFKVDVTRAESVQTMVRGALNTFGCVDVLVNSAGCQDGRTSPTDERFDEDIDLNLKGTYRCTRAVIDVMISRRAGVVLNAAPAVGFDGNGGDACAASRSGVVAMARSWARELGRHGIRVNAVCPGVIEHQLLKAMPLKVARSWKERVPLGRFGKAEEVASVFAFLASDEASYINGAVIEVNGGMAC